MSWIGEQVLFQKPWNGLRPMISLLFGLHAVGRAKSVTSSYADAQQAARRMGLVRA